MESNKTEEVLEDFLGFHDNETAFYNPHHAVLLMNCTREELDTSLNAADAALLNVDKVTDQELLQLFNNPLFSSYTHETAHLFHILGSSSDFFFYTVGIYFSFFGKTIIWDKDLEQFSRRLEVKEFYSGYNNISVIYGLKPPSNKESTIEKISDSILWLFDICVDVYRNLRGYHQNIERIRFELEKELETHKNFLTYFDYYWPPDRERHSNLYSSIDELKVLNFIDENGMMPITAQDIIEGYAASVQFDGFFYRVRRSISSNSSPWRQMSDLLFSLKVRGIYSKAYIYAQNILLKRKNLKDYSAKQLFDIHFDVGMKFIIACELALMTRLHPFLLFKKNTVSIEEILITERFVKVIAYFQKFPIDLSTYYGLHFYPGEKNEAGFIPYLDKICSVLGWLSYSDCLKEIYNSHDPPAYRNSYRSNIGKRVVEEKGNAYIFQPNLKNPITPVPLFKDKKSIYESFDVPEGTAKFQEKRLDHIMTEYFMKETFRGQTSYKKTIQFFKEYGAPLFKGIDEMKKFITENYSPYITPDDVFLTESSTTQ